MSHEGDRTDVEAVLGGEIDRFEGIVNRWQGPLVNLAWRYVRDRPLAEEMAQEAFVHCFRKLHQWRSEAEFSTWLFALALNVYRSFLRKRRPPTDDTVAADSLIRPSSTEAELFDSERRELIRRTVSYLPEIYRDAIVVYYFEDQDLATTAVRLGVPAGTVKARLHRGRELLRERLGRRLE
ncbi:MAG: sigma-70 family RNA polymerase sigma factor [Thermoanaerobaculia bacterium]|nr:sigma-70 family RNA polymerase sigma factor [Thermoanaerobaculia bacterium]